jgi:hypothetical protein
MIETKLGTAADKQKQASASERKRIPMSVPVQKLEAQEIPGYHLHWFLGTPERLQRALDGGYEFVNQREMKINSVGLGNDSAISGNTDLGSRVSVVAGQEVGQDGQATRLVLMKIKKEWFEEDQLAVEKRNEQVANALTGGLIGAEQDARGDTQHRYIDKSRTQIPDLFKPKRALTPR